MFFYVFLFPGFDIRKSFNSSFHVVSILPPGASTGSAAKCARIEPWKSPNKSAKQPLCMFHQFGHHCCHNSKFVGMLCVTVVLANLRRSERVDRNGSTCSFYAISGCEVDFVSWSNEKLLLFLTKFCKGVSSFTVFGFKTSGCMALAANGKSLKFLCREVGGSLFTLGLSTEPRQIHGRSTKS